MISLISTCSLMSYKFKIGDVVEIYSSHPDRLVARTKEYWESRIFLPHLPYQLLNGDPFTYLGPEIINDFHLCKWLVDGRIWFTCVHQNHEKFITCKVLTEI